MALASGAGASAAGGSRYRSERIAEYDRLLESERKLGSAAIFTNQLERRRA
jgi:hypothetical protein